MVHLRIPTRVTPTSDWRVLLPHLQQRAADKWTDVETYPQKFHARRRPTVTKILHAFKTTRNPQNLLHILLHLNERGLVENPYILRSIQGIADNYKDRLRDIESWSVNTRSPRKQSSMLLRHLYADYEVPLFMDSVWYKGGALYQDLYKHLGSGKNLRTADVPLPIQVTKKIAHNFCEAPSHYTVPDALRWAQIHAIGGNRRLVEAIRGTRLVRTFTDDPFWVSLLRFLNSHLLELDQGKINKLVEYIYDIRFVPRRVLIAGGGERQVSPPQPNFNFKGKSLKKLLADAESWEQSAHEDRVIGLEWLPSKKIAPLQFQYPEQGPLWSIRELLSSSELVREGKVMGHCVGEGGYANACYDGESTIWSLSCDQDNLLTIEVEVEENNITEMRGYENRLPTPQELNVVRIWALQNRITDPRDLIG